jgi:hypothetical protein
MADLKEVDPDDERMTAKITVLEELIEHHLEEEEKEMFKVAEKLGTERLSELAEQMEAEAASGTDAGFEDADEEDEGLDQEEGDEEGRQARAGAHHERSHSR